jgi:SAM-dependent methyltransferase
MAEYFARSVGPRGTVEAVDRFDLRQTSTNYNFTAVEGVDLPFPSREFDIVISNHVMEHVGDVQDQIRHLREIHRVLKPSGVAYISVPNRWRVIEPHFHLPLLSWFPVSLASRYVRLARKGDWYDVVPPSRSRMPLFFAAADLQWSDVTVESMETMRRVESPGILSRVVLLLPQQLLRVGLPVVPTMIYIARPATTAMA